MLLTSMLQDHHVCKLQQTVDCQHTAHGILHVATCVADGGELGWCGVEDAFGHTAGVGAGDYGDAWEVWVGLDDLEELSEARGGGMGGVVQMGAGVAVEEGLDGGGNHRCD